MNPSLGAALALVALGCAHEAAPLAVELVTPDCVDGLECFPRDRATDHALRLSRRVAGPAFREPPPPGPDDLEIESASAFWDRLDEWTSDRLMGLGAVERGLSPLRSRGPSHRAMVDAVMGVLYERSAGQIRALRAPRRDASRADRQVAYARRLGELAQPFDERSAAAYGACRRERADATWTRFCRHRRHRAAARAAADRQRFETEREGSTVLEVVRL